MPLSQNSAVLASFVAYCRAHPEFRFWQALRNWSGACAILWGGSGEEWEYTEDTYYWEHDNGYGVDGVQYKVERLSRDG